MEKSNLIWVKIQDTRPIEIDVSGMGNVNSLISILKKRFELQTPEHLLLLTRAGIEIPADMEVGNLSSSFNEPLVLLLARPLISPYIQGEEEDPTAFEEQFKFFKTPPFMGWFGKGTDNEYLNVPVKPLILLFLILGCIDACLLIYLSHSLVYGILFILNIIGFVAVLQNNPVRLSYYAWGRLMLIIPELILDIVKITEPMSPHYELAVIFKYFFYFGYYYCIQKLYAKFYRLNQTLHDDNEQESLLP